MAIYLSQPCPKALQCAMAAITLKPKQLLTFFALTFAFLSLIVLRRQTPSVDTKVHPLITSEPQQSSEAALDPTTSALEPVSEVSAPTPSTEPEQSSIPEPASASSTSVANETSAGPADDLEPEYAPPPPPEESPHPIYKPVKETTSSVPIGEYFPLAASAKSPADLPPIPSWNKPPKTHVPEKTALFIGFTRNWPLLQQAVVGYITAGWPPSDIYVVENTGVMDANKNKKLSLQNPWYLDHDRLTKVFGVNVIVAPVYLSFAQLQNFYLHYAVDKGWPQYFWSHMDILPQSAEDREPYRSLYLRAVDGIRESRKKEYGDWALRFFAYDWLTLVNTAVHYEMGGWDSMISYYSTDCDMYSRMRMLHLKMENYDAGRIYDMGQSLDDLAVLYRKKTSESGEPGSKVSSGSWWHSAPPPMEDARNSSEWHELQAKLKDMQEYKVHGDEPRNSWQTKQTGGQGEPFYRSTDGFEEALEITIKAGERVYQAKWGQNTCDLMKANLKVDDAWKVEKSFDGPGSIVP